MFTVIALAALAATPSLAFQEYVQQNNGAEFTLAQSVYGNTAVAATPGGSRDPKGRQWEFANGQLRNANGRCAYPALREFSIFTRHVRAPALADPKTVDAD